MTIDIHKTNDVFQNYDLTEIDLDDFIGLARVGNRYILKPRSGEVLSLYSDYEPSSLRIDWNREYSTKESWKSFFNRYFQNSHFTNHENISIIKKYFKDRLKVYEYEDNHWYEVLTTGGRVEVLL